MLVLDSYFIFDFPQEKSRRTAADKDAERLKRPNSFGPFSLSRLLGCGLNYRIDFFGNVFDVFDFVCGVENCYGGVASDAHHVACFL